MDDRTLLERAARACALPECGWMGGTFMYVKDNTFTEWNPLTSSADAFELAVKLRMEASFDGQTAWAMAEADPGGGCGEYAANDGPAAARRAIVRAAASLAAAAMAEPPAEGS